MLASLVTPECLDGQVAIVRNVFATMADMRMHPTQALAGFHQAVVSALYFEQAAEAVILVECSEELACIFTSRLLSIDLPSSVDADGADSMAELTNRIGGNLEGLMPAETRSSMPVPLQKESVSAVVGKRTPPYPFAGQLTIPPRL